MVYVYGECERINKLQIQTHVATTKENDRTAEPVLVVVLWKTTKN